MAEIDDNELDLLKRAAALLNLLDQKGGLEFKQMVKKHMPDVSIPEIDVAAPVIERISKVEKEFHDHLASLKSSQVDQELDRSFEALKKQGYTDEGINHIRKLMVDEKIAHPEAAAALFDRRQPKAPVPVSTTSAWNFGKADEKDERAKRLLDDPEGFVDQEASDILNELRNAQ